jgi:hypothetical protein
MVVIRFEMRTQAHLLTSESSPGGDPIGRSGFHQFGNCLFLKFLLAQFLFILFRILSSGPSSFHQLSRGASFSVLAGHLSKFTVSHIVSIIMYTPSAKQVLKVYETTLEHNPWLGRKNIRGLIKVAHPKWNLSSKVRSLKL